ncbi:hypothetical protein COY07_03375 [Candidatus Peregrinibacteria bacterium CG_4_10_14_0_2_um_filter_43_11]|nr:MAG: hypothetical protein COY07_03375 [Candidatus Peregrinibacteria bacterium CG_4_10_14_0_2_um_filter_43_11]
MIENAIHFIKNYPILSVVLTAVSVRFVPSIFEKLKLGILERRSRLKNILFVTNDEAGGKVLSGENKLPQRRQQMDFFDQIDASTTDMQSGGGYGDSPLLAAPSLAPSRFVESYQIPLDLRVIDEPAPTPEEHMKMTCEQNRKSIVDLIARQHPDEEVAVVLVSNFGSEYQYHTTGRRSSDHLYALRLQAALKEQFHLERLRIILILDAEERDLADAIKNNGVDHVVVNGHGTWISWQDANGKSVSNASLDVEMNGRSGVREKEDQICFRSFIRHTCGDPEDEFVTFEDQLGTPFAHHVFGTPIIDSTDNFSYSPLETTTFDEFNLQRSKNKRQIDDETKWLFRKWRYKAKKRFFRRKKVNNWLDKFHIPKKWRLFVPDEPKVADDPRLTWLQSPKQPL